MHFSGQSIAWLSIVVTVGTVVSLINMGIEDVSYIASKVKNFCCFKTMCCRFNRERREGYEHIPDSPNPPVANSGGDVSLLHQRPNPTNKSAEGCVDGSNKEKKEVDKTKLDSANLQEANSGGHTVSVTPNQNLDNGNSEDNPSCSNSPEPVKVEDGSTQTQNVIQMQSWYKIKTAAAIVFFVIICGINVGMILLLNN